MIFLVPVAEHFNFLSVSSFIQRDLFAPRNLQSESNENWSIR